MSWPVVLRKIGCAEMKNRHAMQAARLTRWAGDRVLSDRLVRELHAAYAVMPVGLAPPA